MPCCCHSRHTIAIVVVMIRSRSTTTVVVVVAAVTTMDFLIVVVFLRRVIVIISIVLLVSLLYSLVSSLSYSSFLFHFVIFTNNCNTNNHPINHVAVCYIKEFGPSKLLQLLPRFRFQNTFLFGLQEIRPNLYDR